MYRHSAARGDVGDWTALPDSDRRNMGKRWQNWGNYSQKNGALEHEVQAKIVNWSGNW